MTGLVLAGLWLVTVGLQPHQLRAIAQEELWHELAADSVLADKDNERERLFKLNAEALRKVLANAPMEFDSELADSTAVLNLPMPNGKLAQFVIQESPILEWPLAERYPEIKSYRGQGIENPSATMRADVSPLGFHALVLDGSESFSVLPSANDKTIYASSKANALTDKLRCEADDSKIIFRETNGQMAVNNSVGGTLRMYRIAIAATSEYSAQFGGGDVGQTIASINTWLNAVNTIYEKELAVRMNLIGNNNLVVYTAEPDPFTNGDGIAMLGQVRSTLRNQIGVANYDIGHVLGIGGSGVAYIGVACSNQDLADGLGALKGGGVSLMGGALGNSTYVGLWAHELGHQFGAQHSYNGTTGFCGGSNRSAGSAYESGSGSTIMSYAGVCGSDNITLDRDLRFHAKSFDSITNYLGASGLCAQTSATGNNVPTVNGGTDFTIPKNTPFTLSATGSDADAGDVPNLRYIWEQYDAGGNDYGNPPYDDSGDSSASTRPIFRPFSPLASASRTFPSLTYILNNANNPPDVDGNGLRTAEELPRIGRTLNFRVTIRDQRGGVNTDDVQLQVASGAGPFAVTAPESAVNWSGGTNQIVTWSVAGTNAAPVNCSNVKISLSTDGGNTFPHVLAASTPNDGSETIIAPVGLNTSTARVKVEAVGNIFFDISGVNFTVQGGSCSYSLGSTSQNFSAAGGNGSVNVTAPNGCAWTATSNVGWVTINSGTPGNGNGTVQFTVAANGGVARNGTMTIAGQTFTVMQATNCSTITVNPSSLSGGTVGDNYSQTITATGGNPSYTFSVLSGTLPPGLNLSSGGSLSGTLSAAGIYSFTIQAADANGCTGTRAYSVTVNAVGLMFYPLPKPVRLLDTRAGQPGCDAPGQPIFAGTERTQLARRTCDGVTIPANAVAVTGNITPVPPSAGFLTLFPSNATRPLVASSNFAAGEIVNNVFTVGLGSDGAFKIYASATTEVVVDVSGYYAPPQAGGLYFHPLPQPIRLLETRAGQPGCDTPGAPINGGTSRTQQGRVTCNGVTIPAAAQALVGNATVVTPASAGYITLFPSNATQPLVSNGNYVGGDIVNTPFTVGLGTDGAFKIFSSSTTHIVMDVLGYFSTEANDVNGQGLLFYSLGSPVRLLDSRAGQPACFTPGAAFNAGVEYTQQARVTCNGQIIANNAQAVLGNVTTVNPSAGFLTLWPSNVSRPLVATSNFATGQIANRHFVVGLGTDGAFKLYASGTTHLVIDLSGYFAP
ncbi:MAG: M12 family metallo-peptidase [Acidobacteriota bacterium]|nr:M12 family metallo-peptidase [Acidobacteriota bacterium]